MIRERLGDLKDFFKDFARAPYEVYKDFKGEIMASLAKKLVKEPTPEEREVIEFAAELLRKTLESFGALTHERAQKKAEKMGPDMVKISKVANLGSGAAGHHDSRAELVRLSDTTDVHQKLEVVIHEFVHHLFIQIRRGRAWMGVDEGLVEGLTQYVLRSNAAEIFERYPAQLPYGNETPLARRLDVFWKVRTSYVDQVETMQDVMTLLAAHEGIPRDEAERDFYKTFLGVMPFRSLAKRVERACGPGALRLLRGMVTAHERVGVSYDTAERSVIDRIIAPTYVSPTESLPENTPMLTVEMHDDQALPPSGMALVEQYKYLRKRFFAEAETLLREGPPYDAIDTGKLTRALKNLILWRKMHLDDADHWDDQYKHSVQFRNDRKAFIKKYGKQTRFMVSQIRAALRDSTRLNREMQQTSEIPEQREQEH